MTTVSIQFFASMRVATSTSWSAGNLEKASLSLSIGAASKPARVSKGGLLGALGCDLSGFQSTCGGERYGVRRWVLTG